MMKWQSKEDSWKAQLKNKKKQTNRKQNLSDIQLDTHKPLPSVFKNKMAIYILGVHWYF